MSLSARAIAVSGLGFGVLLTAASGLSDFNLPAEAHISLGGGGGYFTSASKRLKQTANTYKHVEIHSNKKADDEDIINLIVSIVTKELLS